MANKANDEKKPDANSVVTPQDPGTTPPEEPKVEKSQKKDVVEIDRAQLTQILDAVESFQKEIARRTVEEERVRTEIEVLREAANRSRLEAADAKHGNSEEDERPRGHLRSARGKIIWKWLSKRESEVVAKNHMILKGADVVDEIINAHFILMDTKTLEDGSVVHEEMIMPYLEFAQAAEQHHFRVVDGAGTKVWTCEFEDPILHEKYGRFELPTTFANP